MQFLFRRSPLIDQAQELEPLLMAMPLLAEADHLPAGSVHCCEQRRSAMPFIVVGHGFRAVSFQRQSWLATIQCLYLAFFINTKNDRLLGRIQVQTHDGVQLFAELWIIADLEGFHPMRLQTMRMPNPEDAGIADSAGHRHASSAPMGGVFGLFLSCLAHDFSHRLFG